jgi:hypothetical protein
MAGFFYCAACMAGFFYAAAYMAGCFCSAAYMAVFHMRRTLPFNDTSRLVRDPLATPRVSAIRRTREQSQGYCLT